MRLCGLHSSPCWPHCWLVMYFLRCACDFEGGTASGDTCCRSADSNCSVMFASAGDAARSRYIQAMIARIAADPHSVVAERRSANRPQQPRLGCLTPALHIKLFQTLWPP